MVSKTAANAFVEEIHAIPGGEGLRLCIQCGTCSGSCPNADKMEHTPRELVAMVRAGMWEEVLSSNSMWFCLSCYLCTVRCPRGIKLTDLMHALESMAIRHGVMSRTRTFTPLMYRSFSDFVYGIGSVQEMGFMAWFYLLSRNPLRAVRMLPLGISLLRHGRMPVKARRLKPEAERQLRAILDKAEILGGRS